MRRFVLAAAIVFCGVSQGLAQPDTPAPDMAQAWDSVLKDTAQLPTQVRPVENPNPASDFFNHFFFETRTEYWRSSTSFTGLPTATGIINTPFTGVFNPAGVPYPAVFQPDANRIYSFIDWGTKGWLWDRVNTHFAFRYAQDLTSVNQGVAAQDILETYGSNRSLQLMTGTVEIAGKPTDGIWAGTTLQLGRQFVYGAELAALDGAAFSIERQRFEIDLFGGRRFTYDSVPEQRAIGGSNVIFRLPHETSLEYSGLWYIKGSNSVTFSKRFQPGWLLSAHFRAYGGSPVDFTAQAMYFSANGKTSLRMSYFQKLTDRDYFYDFTDSATDRDPHNLILRLNLGPLVPYSQFVVDAHRSVTARLRLAASIWVRRLNDSSGQGPFDTSFQDYRVNAQVLTVRKTEVFLEYHERDSDRLSPLNATSFDDIQAAGETSVKDLSAEVRHSFGEGRLRVSGGAYYRRISLQDQFTVVNGAHESGWLGSAWLKVDQHSRLFFDYNLDNDFFVFRPSIANSRILRLGLSWKY